MCVLAFAWSAHPRWPLLVAANRDELHERPSAPLARWSDLHHLIGGRDLRSGGTWLGVSERGRLVTVTNRRGFGDPLPEMASRGALVADLLSGEGVYADPANARLSDFNPFNLIHVDGTGAHYLSNRPESTRTALAPGIYGLSNGGLDEPWPKTLQLKAFLLRWVVEAGDDPAALLDVLRTEGLPDFGIPPEAPSDIAQEPAQSPIFIRNPVYGTRCSTVVAVDAEGRGTIIERRFDAKAEPIGETMLNFTWPHS